MKQTDSVITLCWSVWFCMYWYCVLYVLFVPSSFRSTAPGIQATHETKRFRYFNFCVLNREGTAEGSGLHPPHLRTRSITRTSWDRSVPPPLTWGAGYGPDPYGTGPYPPFDEQFGWNHNIQEIHTLKNIQRDHMFWFEIRNRVTVATPVLSCDSHVQIKSEGGCHGEWSR